VLPVRVFSMVKVGVSPEVNVLATLLLLISLFCLAIFAWIIKRKPEP
jgi:spermidine/putrescine transport system permease protein